ncbi:hypothetical protein H4219_003708 [Mycoemilia scoparia]|uniref:Methionine synthase reductase n=1 Tax=Mycoemilia scoparia TaxID=417184 RepID=A0A9W7ZY62_9FUNG|nr:hypothetical protein H4219_003708 [Mycoemilia scoparia]
MTSSEEKAKSVQVFYASQTGNAESIARNIHKEAVKKGFDSQVYVLNDHEKVGFENVRVGVFVVSTTGDGDPPDNATKFWRVLRRKTRGLKNSKDGANGSSSASLYPNLKYAILGLGDTNYSNFCNTAKVLDSQLKKTGAKEFYPKGLADDGTGLEETVDPWIEKLWDALGKVVELKSESKSDDGGLHKAVSRLKLRDEDSASELSQSVHSEHLPNPQPFFVDYSGMKDIKALTGTPKLPTQSCNMVDAPLSGSELQRNSSSNSASSIDLLAFARDKVVSEYPEFIIPKKGNGTAGDVVESFVPRTGSTPTFLATITSAESLTTELKKDVKRTLLLELDLGETGRKLVNGKWRAGDSFGIWAPNDRLLVTAILDKLGVEVSDMEKPIRLSPIGSDGKNVEHEGSKLPSHLSLFEHTTTTLFELYQWAVDLTSGTGLMKKQLIRYLASACTQVDDRDRLLYLCSRQGLKEWSKFRDQAPRLLDILQAFPSCHPDPVFLIELLPPLVPRAYSIASTPQTTSSSRNGSWKFAFNIVKYQTQVVDPSTNKMIAVSREGLCTPWLDHITGNIAPKTKLSNLKIQIPVFLRARQNDFFLPSPAESGDESPSRPIIMIGPGTGIAAFIGFLEQATNERLCENTDSPPKEPEMILFYGCRYWDHDFLFQSKLEEFKSKGPLSDLYISLSRDEVKSHTFKSLTGSFKSKYVQHEMARPEVAKNLCKLIVDKDALIYVCGDAQGMGKDVNNALADIIFEYLLENPKKANELLSDIHDPGNGMGKDLARQDAEQNVTKIQILQLLMKWIQTKKYRRDLWA